MGPLPLVRLLILLDTTFAHTPVLPLRAITRRRDGYQGPFASIDSIGSLLQDVQSRHFQRWPIMGMSSPAPAVNVIGSTFAVELDTLKHWIVVRLQWLDANISGHCGISDGPLFDFSKQETVSGRTERV